MWGLFAVVTAALVSVPRWTTPTPDHRPAPSVVDEDLCSGCEQCYLDCPYDAIAMIARPGETAGRSALVAHVNPEACVSCGICAGSCAPMGVGPPGRTGRDQLAAVRAFVAAWRFRPGGGVPDAVVIACDRGAGGVAHSGEFAGAPVWPITCAGNLHTSVIELLIRAGVGGVLVVSCPPRDCWSREGPKWLEQRVYHDREAELQPRVERRRVRLAHAGVAERAVVAAALHGLREEVARLGVTAREGDADLQRECDIEGVAR